MTEVVAEKSVHRQVINNRHLKPVQRMVFNHPVRFRVLVTGRRFGKSYLGADELIKFASWPLNDMGWGPEFNNLTGMDMNVWYVAPTYGMAKDIVWWVLLDRLDQLNYNFEINNSELKVELLDHGSTISLKGADNYNSLRGRGLNFAVIDEYACIPKEAWTEVLRPALSDRNGHALFTGTPMGFTWAYDLFRKGRDGVHGWDSWQFTTLDGGYVSADEIDAASADLDERVFRQEYLASFENYSGIVYYNFSRDPTGTVIGEQHIDGPAIHVGMDFNVNPMTACVAEIIDKKVFIRDEIRIFGSNTYEMADEIQHRYPHKRVFVYPDPACMSRHTSAPGGVTDLSILEEAGFSVMVRHAHTLVRDRINAVNSKLKNARGERGLFVGSNCKYIINCLERQCYKEGTNVPDKTGGLDHGSDAVGYLVDYLFPVVERKTEVIQI